MALYRFYRLHEFVLVGSEEAPAPNDEDAVRLARSLAAKGQVVEIWRSGRRVRTIAAA